MPEAPFIPEDRGDPANDGGVPPFLIGGPDPVAPWGGRRPGVRFAAGLSRQHGWRRPAARLIAAAIVLAFILLALAELFRA